MEVPAMKKKAFIRKLLLRPSKPAIVILNNVIYDTGVNAQDYHNAVGKWYMVLYVSVRDTLYQSMKAGKYIRLELTEDGIHPNDKGHGLVAREINSFQIEGIAKESGKGVNTWDMYVKEQGKVYEGLGILPEIIIIGFMKM